MNQDDEQSSKFDGAIYLKPGLYELIVDSPNSYVSRGYWPAGTRFVVEHCIQKYEDQDSFEYLIVRLASSQKILTATYQNIQWNALAIRLVAAKDDIEEFIIQGDIPPLYVLDQLEQTGRISREDIWHAIEERRQLVE